MDRDADQVGCPQVNPHSATVWGAAEGAIRPARPESAAGRGPPPPGRHRAEVSLVSRDGIRRLLGNHGARFVSFSAVGGFVFVLGLAIQALLVQVWRVGSDASYVVQGIISIQVSFLLNYHWTWRDKEISFWPSWYKFNTQKIITTVFNLLIYAALIAVRVNYLVANIATTAIFTAVNYVIGNFWTFVPAKGKSNCPPQ